MEHIKDFNCIYLGQTVRSQNTRTLAPIKHVPHNERCTRLDKNCRIDTRNFQLLYETKKNKGLCTT